MPLRLDLYNPTSRPNMTRLFEDISSTLDLVASLDRAGRGFPLSACPLRLIGRCLRGELDTGFGEAMLAQPAKLTPLASRPALRLLGGRVHLSYALAAIALTEPDGPWAQDLLVDRRWDIECLAWLVLVGIREHRLWIFVSEAMISELLERSIPIGTGHVSPLELCVLTAAPASIEGHPEVGTARFHDWFVRWLATDGCAAYDLFWLMSVKQLARSPYAHERLALVRPAPPDPSSQAPEAPLKTSYTSFGPGFPSLRVQTAPAETLAAPYASSKSAALTLDAEGITLPLPPIWYPGCALLIDIVPLPDRDPRTEIEITMNRRVLDRRTLAGYAGQTAIIVSLEPADHQSSLLTIAPRFTGEPSLAPAAVIAVLRTLDIWKLRS